MTVTAIFSVFGPSLAVGIDIQEASAPGEVPDGRNGSRSASALRVPMYDVGSVASSVNKTPAVCILKALYGEFFETQQK